MKFLIAGLGNIGDEYENTRHNIGFMVLDRLAKRHNVSFDLKRHAFCAEIKFKGKTLQLIKPTTYMNLSGKAVAYWMQEHKIGLEHLLVVCDDLAIPFAALRLKGKGSSGGQNGLNHIIATLNTDQYARLRCGIGNNFSKGKQVDFVLSAFDNAEQAELELYLEKGADAIEAFCTLGIERAMNVVNTKEKN